MVDVEKFFSEIAEQNNLLFKVTKRSLILKCPNCGKSKLYFDKSKGNFRCFSGSCGITGQAEKLASLILNISYEEAKALLNNDSRPVEPIKGLIEGGIIDLFVDKPQKITKEALLPIETPGHFLSLEDEKSVEGLKYLENRGIPYDIAIKYKILYSPIYRRVIFPIVKDGLLYGYQGRAIDKVLPGQRMRNNEGFQKGRAFMFLDNAKSTEHVIVAEGPVDAIKFDQCGGNIASMGKDLTKDQINALNSLPSKKIYWALDDDAKNMIREYAKDVDKVSYVVTVPQAAKARILASGKDKADFGECTYAECMEAISMAIPTSGLIIG